MSVTQGHLTPQRRETLKVVYSAFGDSWVRTSKIRELHSDLGRLAVLSRLSGLVLGGFMERSEGRDAKGQFAEWRVTEKGRQQAE
jgi:DNA-binding HxlR family transcriptional regulator